MGPPQPDSVMPYVVAVTPNGSTSLDLPASSIARNCYPSQVTRRPCSTPTLRVPWPPSSMCAECETRTFGSGTATRARSATAGGGDQRISARARSGRRAALEAVEARASLLESRMTTYGRGGAAFGRRVLVRLLATPVRHGFLRDVDPSILPRVRLSDAGIAWIVDHEGARGGRQEVPAHALRPPAHAARPRRERHVLRVGESGREKSARHDRRRGSRLGRKRHQPPRPPLE